MDTLRSRPRWFHWLFLTLSAVDMLILGVLDVTSGASPQSLMYAVDDVVVRVLGAGLILGAIGLSLRRRWTFTAAIWVLALSMVEIVVTTDYANEPLLDTVFLLGIMVDFLGVPLALLVWLRRVMLRDQVRQLASPQ